MNRLVLIGTIAAFVIVIAGMIAAILLFMPWMLPQKDVAVSIATSDPVIRDAMMSNIGSVTIGNATPLDEYETLRIHQRQRRTGAGPCENGHLLRRRSLRRIR